MEEKNKRQLQAEATRNAIIEATVTLMKDRHLSEVTIREITKAAHVSIGTFYVYFSCKEAVLLYGYRGADESFEKLALTGSREANMRALLNTYLHLVTMQHLSETREIYIAHITYHDAYFFDEQRPIFQLLKKELLRYDLSEETARHMTWKLLEFARGAIYNLCIHEEGYHLDTWHEEKLEELCDYLSYLLQK